PNPGLVLPVPCHAPTLVLPVPCQTPVQLSYPWTPEKKIPARVVLGVAVGVETGSPRGVRVILCSIPPVPEGPVRPGPSGRSGAWTGCPSPGAALAPSVQRCGRAGQQTNSRASSPGRPVHRRRPPDRDGTGAG